MKWQGLTFIAISFVVSGALANNCGRYRTHTDLIVRGEKLVDTTAWPWIVGLFHRSQTSTTLRCGASLVNRYVVVTAAHCVEENGYTLDASDILLVMGRSRVQAWQHDRNVQIRSAKNVVIHPSYEISRISGADLALIELETPVTYTEYVAPVCLWNSTTDHEFIGSNGTVVGWGRDETGTDVTETARKTKLPIVDTDVCFASNRKFRDLVNEHKFCAGNRDGTGPCNGDSGSGMYVRRTNEDGDRSWVLRGLVSRSVVRDDDSGLCDLTNYIVFTDLAKLKTWLSFTSCSVIFNHTTGAVQNCTTGQTMCQALTELNCCEFGLETWVDSDDCERCRCNDPCRKHSCPEGTICAVGRQQSIEVNRFQYVCRLESCMLPKEQGPGHNFTIKWFYDTEYGDCVRFWYGGIDGNANHYNSQEECKQTCIEPTGRVACTSSELTCGDGKCVDFRRRCDGHRDCLDGLDEQGCSNCKADEFQCIKDGVCVNEMYRCDAYLDCEDGSDELDCSISTPSCLLSEFSCGDGSCIPPIKKCDGTPDCANGADENSCPPRVTCTSSELTCGDGKCVDFRRRCDGHRDCLDGLDEQGCSNQTIHPNCTDRPIFANCNMIVQATYCTNQYYRRVCCRSCTEAGQLPLFGPHLVNATSSYQ